MIREANHRSDDDSERDCVLKRNLPYQKTLIYPIPKEKTIILSNQLIREVNHRSDDDSERVVRVEKKKSTVPENLDPPYFKKERKHTSRRGRIKFT